MLRGETLAGRLRIHAFDALNDLVASRASLSRVVDCMLMVNGEKMTTYVADGVILATPTGSTAYAMAAGGPIMHPEVRGILVTPIAPYLTIIRSLILPEDSQIELDITTDDAAFLTVDGQTHVPLEDGDAIRITTSPVPALFARLQPRPYFAATLTQRLHPARADPSRLWRGRRVFSMTTGADWARFGKIRASPSTRPPPSAGPTWSACLACGARAGAAGACTGCCPAPPSTCRKAEPKTGWRSWPAWRAARRPGSSAIRMTLLSPGAPWGRAPALPKAQPLADPRPGGRRAGLVAGVPVCGPALPPRGMVLAHGGGRRGARAARRGRHRRGLPGGAPRDDRARCLRLDRLRLGLSGGGLRRSRAALAHAADHAL